MVDFNKGLTEQERIKYNHLIDQMYSDDDFDKVKRLQTQIILLREKGLTRLKKQQQSS